MPGLAEYRQMLLWQGFDDAFIEQMDEALETMMKDVNEVNAYALDEAVFPFMIPGLFKNEFPGAPQDSDSNQATIDKQLASLQRVKRQLDGSTEPYPYFRAR